MKKYLIIILSIFLLHTFICSAQGRPDSNIEKLKREYFTRQLRLNPVESRAFWSMYRQYEKDCAAAWRESNRDTNLFKEKVAILKDEYRENFIAILHSHERADMVYKVDRDFRIMVEKIYKGRNPNPSYRRGR